MPDRDCRLHRLPAVGRQMLLFKGYINRVGRKSLKRSQPSRRHIRHHRSFPNDRNEWNILHGRRATCRASRRIACTARMLERKTRAGRSIRVRGRPPAKCLGHPKEAEVDTETLRTVMSADADLRGAEGKMNGDSGCVHLLFRVPALSLDRAMVGPWCDHPHAGVGNGGDRPACPGAGR